FAPSEKSARGGEGCCVVAPFVARPWPLPSHRVLSRRTLNADSRDQSLVDARIEASSPHVLPVHQDKEIGIASRRIGKSPESDRICGAASGLGCLEPFRVVSRRLPRGLNWRVTPFHALTFRQ